MALEYDVYLNDTLLSDTPIGMDDFNLTVIREGGITSDDQILRLKTEAELTFWGDGYGIICAAKQDNYCQNITVRIVMRCDEYSRLAFIGIMPLVGTVADVTRKTIKARIRDNSFSGYIRERQNNKVFLTATTSANGTTIASCPTRTITFFDPTTGVYDAKSVRVYDVYDVLKYLIKNLSDDTVNVVSDYFGSGAGYHKYAITMGGMIYGGTTWAAQTALPTYFTPNVSFAEVFRELRKKLRIYMSVDTDINGVPTVRIEPESYFYSNVELKAINGIPFDLVEDYDIETVYSEIKVGSTETKVDDGTYYNYPKLTLYSFENENYNSCSDCVEENTLDLVSEWIIDSNVIWFTFDQDNSSSPPDSPENVANGDKVFLIETDSNLDKAEATLYGVGNYYYNSALTNYQVLTNWAGGIPECVARYFADLCLDACATDITISNPGISVTTSRPLEFTITNDCLRGIFTETFDFTFISGTTYSVNLGDTGSYFIAPTYGTYNFTFTSDIIAVPSGGSYVSELIIAAFTNSSYLTAAANITAQLIQIDTASTGSPSTSSTVTVNSSMSLSPGNVVVFLRWTDFNLYSGTLKYDNPCAQLTFYDINEQINFVSNDYLRKPLRWTFENDICESEFINILQDKTGYMTIDGNRGWIKQIEYRPQKTSLITLQATNSLCC